MGLNNAVQKLLVGRWIAGEGVEEAIRRTRRFNARGIETIINYLGEEFRDKREVDDAVATYLKLIRAIKESGVMADVSLKLTQLGLRIDKGMAERNYTRILSFAKKSDVFVWIDEETYGDVGPTMAIYKRYCGGGFAGITIQSSLRRSLNDIRGILKAKGVVRLVKGAYHEPEQSGFNDRAEITRNYYVLMDYLFRHGNKFTIATHDLNIVRKALSLNRRYNRAVEYAMLNGIRNSYAMRLASEGHTTYIYVPFGRRWIDYSYRRMREASNIKLLLHSLLEDQRI